MCIWPIFAQYIMEDRRIGWKAQSAYVSMWDAWSYISQWLVCNWCGVWLIWELGPLVQNWDKLNRAGGELWDSSIQWSTGIWIFAEIVDAVYWIPPSHSYHRMLHDLKNTNFPKINRAHSFSSVCTTYCSHVLHIPAYLTTQRETETIVGKNMEIDTAVSSPCFCPTHSVQCKPQTVQ